MSRKELRAFLNNPRRCKNAFLGDDYLNGMPEINTHNIDRLWHFFSNYDFFNDIKINDYFLLGENDEYSENYGMNELDVPHGQFKKVKLTHSTHCTTSSGLYRVFYFEMNAGTKEWLLAKKTFSGLPLEDIAFYKGRECIFGVCTHEDYYFIPEGEYYDAIKAMELPCDAFTGQRLKRNCNTVRQVKEEMRPGLIEAARQGDPIAQFELGDCYFYGNGVESDYGEAVGWYIKASEQGCAEASILLGYTYERGGWVEANDAEALYYFMKAAEQGNKEAQYIVGRRHFYGNGAEQDFVKAVQFYKQAAEQGHVEAQYSLGYCYYRGEGLKQDYVKAFELFFLAGEQGYAEAKYALGRCYANGDGVSRDYCKAVELWSEIEEISGEAKFALAISFANGLGVEQNLEKAADLFEQASIWGVPDALHYAEAYHFKRRVKNQRKEQ